MNYYWQQLAEFWQELADKTLPHMSWQYYEQRLKAIGILAGIAAERLGNE